jgi:hypothetical protein
MRKPENTETRKKCKEGRKVKSPLCHPPFGSAKMGEEYILLLAFFKTKLRGKKLYCIEK